jgi:phosphoribosylglycinamide formyltransferase-1
VTIDLGILVSGSGTNLQSILDAVDEHRLDARVRVVISNKPGAYALERAARAGVPVVVLEHKAYASREDFDRELVRALRRAEVEWVVLAGFMRILTREFLAAYQDRIVNIHPALLPAFPGTHAQRQAVEYGVKVSGCTVHLVDEGVDTGPIIAQRAVPVLDDDDEASLGQRILEQEHALMVEVLQSIAAGHLEVVRASGRRPRVTMRRG